MARQDFRNRTRQRGHGSYLLGQHNANEVAIPQFDAENPIHTRLTALSQQAHQLVAAGDEVSLAAVEAQVDEAAAEL